MGMVRNWTRFCFVVKNKIELVIDIFLWFCLNFSKDSKLFPALMEFQGINKIQSEPNFMILELMTVILLRIVIMDMLKTGIKKSKKINKKIIIKRRNKNRKKLK